MLQEELAWFAGLFEGEGCIYLLSKNNAWSWYLKITMTDLDVIEKAHKIVSCGTVRADTPPKKKHWSQSYTWEVGNRRDVLTLLKLITPFFGERRREKARTALHQLENWEQNTVETWNYHSDCIDKTDEESCSFGRLKRGSCSKHYQRRRRADCYAK